jgi:anti-sigma factor RsiW
MNGEDRHMALCKDIVENIMDYIDAELDDQTLAELEKHATDCPECQAFIRTYKKMLELAGKLRNRSFVTPDVRKRLKELLRSKLNSG